jgi:single-strand selective monofunctional uracil DNA glycosylase
MKITGEVRKPSNEIASKPIEGLNCTREEQSGKRFWGVIEELCGTPENFFKHCFVYNICPFAFLHSSGRNITPPEIKGDSKNQLKEVCVDYLRQAIEVLNPQIIISIGSYANDRIKELTKKNLINPKIDCKLIPHPSPRSVGNHNWIEKAKQWYVDNQIIEYFQN